jgi:putative addiction module killer protein
MSDLPIELLEYLDRHDRNPFRDWLEGLKDQQARARIRVRLNRVRLGNFGDCKSLGGGVSELRISHGPGYRVYFGRKGNTVVILLCGGDKGTQSKDIALAQAYWEDYQRRTK